MMDEELLINLVHGYRELYDLQDPHYDDKQRRDNIWKEIGDTMKESAKTCRYRWRRIRDNYRRAKRLRKTKSGQAATNMKKPKYEDLLSFLNPYMSNEYETFTNVSQDANNEDSNLLEDSHSRDSPCSSAGTSRSNVRKHSSSSEDSTPRCYKRNSRSLPTPPQLSPTHLVFQDYSEKKYKKKSEKIVDFFKNLGETVANFPEGVQIHVKRDVFKIVNDAEELIFMEKSKPQYVLGVSSNSYPMNKLSGS